MLKTFFIAAIVFFLIDILWLGLVANSFYKDRIGFLLKEKPNWVAATIFYFIFIIGLIVFAINPSETVKEAVLLGGLFGFIAYATYDLTNLSTIDKWPVKLVIVDMIWGTILSGLVSGITKYLI